MPVNCWEFKKCGREPGGSKAKELGICQAAEDKTLDGVHGGKNAGRSCWAVCGTLCGGKVQGTYAEKLGNCLQCDFYKVVFTEAADFKSVGTLARMRKTFAVAR